MLRDSAALNTMTCRNGSKRCVKINISHPNKNFGLILLLVSAPMEISTLKASITGFRNAKNTEVQLGRSVVYSNLSSTILGLDKLPTPLHAKVNTID